MGFNFFNYGNIHPCGISNGFVYYVLPSGKNVYFPTSIEGEIPIQTNLFISDRVAFILYSEDKMYLGRYDKSISIYRKSDGLLVGLNTWEPPKYSETVLCGFYNMKGEMHEIHLDLKDKQTVYICGTNLEGKLKEPIKSEFDNESSLFSATVHGNAENYHIFSQGGEPIEVDVWTVQDDVRKQNCPIFL